MKGLKLSSSLVVRPELLVLFFLFVALGVLNVTQMHQVAVLNFYFLPVVLAGYFFGRTRAVTTAIAAIAIVCWFGLLRPEALPESERLTRWLEIGLWGTILVLTGASLGHLYEAKNRAFTELQQAYHGVLEILTKFIDTADKYTEAHSVRVAKYSGAMATRLGLSPQEIEDVRVAALLHDIGKVSISMDVLRKAGKLTEEEWEEIKRHPEIGARIVGKVGGMLKNVVPLILYHHEQYSGEGYYRLKAEQIPLGARVIAVADAYDAMTSLRPYREPMDPDQALEMMYRQAGKQFDPMVLDALREVIRDLSSDLAVETEEALAVA